MSCDLPAPNPDFPTLLHDADSGKSIFLCRNPFSALPAGSQFDFAKRQYKNETNWRREGLLFLFPVGFLLPEVTLKWLIICQQQFLPVVWWAFPRGSAFQLQGTPSGCAVFINSPLLVPAVVGAEGIATSCSCYLRISQCSFQLPTWQSFREACLDSIPFHSIPSHSILSFFLK